MTTYTYKQEKKTVAATLGGRTTKTITQYAIRDAEGALYATAPADWTEADVMAGVDRLNASAAGADEMESEKEALYGRTA